MGLPRDTIRPLTPEEIRNVRTPHCRIARDHELLQYLPDNFFNTPEGKAALERVARYDNAKYRDSAGGKAALADRLLSLLPIRTGVYSPQQVHTERTGTNERKDMYPGMIWRYETPNARAIKHVHIGDEDLVFVQPGETDHVLHIGVFNKTGGNTGDKAGGNTGDNTGDKAGGNTGDKAGGKVGGETNVIVLGAEDEVIDNILIAAWPSYLRQDEGLVRVLRNGGRTLAANRSCGQCPVAIDRWHVGNAMGKLP
jgi:hypothetical protein